MTDSAAHKGLNVGIIRKAANKNIVPLQVKMKHPVSEEAFEEFIGVSVAQADFNSITFQNEDLEKPFISYDEAMWDYFEPELSRRLAQLDVDDSVSARVGSAFDRADAGKCLSWNEDGCWKERLS